MLLLSCLVCKSSKKSYEGQRSRAGQLSRSAIRCHLGWAEGLQAKDGDSDKHTREGERKESRGRRRKRERNRKEQKRREEWVAVRKEPMGPQG